MIAGQRMESKTLNRLRKQVDAIDRGILRLLSRRLKVADSIGTLKKSLTLPLKDQQREMTLLAARMKQGRSLGLDERFVYELMHKILTASLQAQQKDKKKRI